MRDYVVDDGGRSHAPTVLAEDTQWVSPQERGSRLPPSPAVEPVAATRSSARAFQGSQELRETQQRAGLKEPPRMLVVNET